MREVSEEKLTSKSVVTAKSLYGEYLAESRAEQVKDTIRNYFQSSIDLLDTFKDNKHKTKNTVFEKAMKNFDQFEIESKFKTYRAIAICKFSYNPNPYRCRRL